MNAPNLFVQYAVARTIKRQSTAIAMLRNGHNQQLIRLANEIIVTQREEIAAMRLAIAEPDPRK